MSDAQFIWFDNSYYQLQRLKTIGSNSTMDATFGYKKVTIEAPDDSTDLPSNKYIVPGQSDPVTIPEGGVGPDVKDLFGN